MSDGDAVVEQHRELLAALRSADPDRAERAVEEHIAVYLQP